MKILITGFLLLVATSTYAITPDQIVKKCDDVRNPGESFIMKVAVKELSGSKTKSSFDVYIGGKDRTLIKTTAPRRDKGRNMLMLEENMWLYIPNLKRSVRISLSQKLSGQAANGDIARMRWHGDYKAKLEKTTKSAYVLFLQASKKGLTYDKIRVWVSKKNFHPTKAEYMALTGKVLKNATFGGKKKIAGKVRPTQIIITDAVNKNKKTEINIVKMVKKNLPMSMFKKNNLK
ncbi:MAG: outer membrane lipoprotein-sorting protein [Bacteriovoracaceae bacterium]|nr:outer membrane lipoprotein-sorting protein [Bacteriovoracaceae bacterium]